MILERTLAVDRGVGGAPETTNAGILCPPPADSGRCRCLNFFWLNVRCAYAIDTLRKSRRVSRRIPCNSQNSRSVILGRYGSSVALSMWPMGMRIRRNTCLPESSLNPIMKFAPFPCSDVPMIQVIPLNAVQSLYWTSRGRR